MFDDDEIKESDDLLPEEAELEDIDDFETPPGELAELTDESGDEADAE